MEKNTYISLLSILIIALAGFLIFRNHLVPKQNPAPAPEATTTVEIPPQATTTATSSPVTKNPTQSPKPPVAAGPTSSPIISIAPIPSTTTPNPVPSPLPPTTAAATSSPPVPPVALASDSDPRITQIIDLTNAERKKAGLPPLAENGRLDRAAQAKTADENSGQYFSHTRDTYNSETRTITTVTYTNFAKDAGYFPYAYLGENLSLVTDPPVRYADVMRAWMNSPGHKANILNPHYKDIGIGITIGYYNNAPAVYIAQYFGTLK